MRTYTPVHARTHMHTDTDAHTHSFSLSILPPLPPPSLSQSYDVCPSDHAPSSWWSCHRSYLSPNAWQPSFATRTPALSATTVWINKYTYIYIYNILGMLSSIQSYLCERKKITIYCDILYTLGPNDIKLHTLFLFDVWLWTAFTALALLYCTRTQTLRTQENTPLVWLPQSCCDLKFYQGHQHW